MFGKKLVYLNVVLAGVLLLTMFTPVTVFASPEIVTVQSNVSSIAPGGQITITGTVSADVRYVWAMAGNTRVNGVLTGQNFTIQNVRPTRTGNVYVYANSQNNTNGAARNSVHITILGIAQGTTPQPSPSPSPAPQQPTTPQTPTAPTGFRVGAITEIPASTATRVKLRVETGPDATHVWIRYGPGRATHDAEHASYLFRAGELYASTATTRTWLIEYPTSSQTQQGVVQHIPHTPHRVSVIAYRDQTGDDVRTILGRAIRNGHIQDFDVALEAEFTAPRNFVISNRSVIPRSVSLGNSARIRITTNQDVEAVWVRDLDGNIIPARRIPPLTPETTRNFEVFVTPSATGNVTIFAGQEVGDANAASITENIAVTSPHLAITQAIAQRAAAPNTSEEATIRVTTNQHVNSVWATLPCGEIIRLSMTGISGEATRVWEATPAGVSSPNIAIRATATHTNSGGITQNITAWGTLTQLPAAVTPTTEPITVTNITQTSTNRGTNTTVQFTVPATVTTVVVKNTEHNIVATVNLQPAIQTGNTRVWAASFTLPQAANIADVALTIAPFVGTTPAPTTTHTITLTN